MPCTCRCAIAAELDEVLLCCSVALSLKVMGATTYNTSKFTLHNFNGAQMAEKGSSSCPRAVQAGLDILRGRLRPISTMDHACVNLKAHRGLHSHRAGLARHQHYSLEPAAVLSHCCHACAETHATRERCTVIVPSSGILDFQKHFEYYARALQEGLAG